MFSKDEVRGLYPRGVPDRDRRRMTIDLDDFAKQQPADGQVARWDAARHLWVPVNIGSLVKLGSAYLTDHDTVTASVAEVWGAGAVITNPGHPISVVATLSGFVRNFTTADVGRLLAGISVDGGSSYAAVSGTQFWAITGGGSTVNRAPLCVTVGYSGPVTGDVIIRGEVLSGHVDTVYEQGIVTYVLVAA